MISQEKAATEQEIMVLGARAVMVQKEQGLATSKIFICSRQREPVLHVGSKWNMKDRGQGEFLISFLKQLKQWYN